MSALSTWLNRGSLYIALLAAWIAMLGSLYFSLVKGFVPCDLCWYQRILMYPLTLVIAAGLILRDRHLPKIILPLSSLGLGVALYHYLLEKTDLFDGVQLCTNGAACTTMWINWFGFVTIPFLSLTAFTLITVMAVVALMAGEPDAEERPLFGRAWVGVAAVILPVVVLYGVSFSNGWQRQQEARALQEAFTQTTAAGPLSSAADSRSLAGATLYQEACAACHGPNAEGVANLGNSLQANAFIASLSDAELLQFIRAGRDLESPDNTSGLVMPPSGGRPDLTDSEMNEIIQFLRAHQ